MKPIRRERDADSGNSIVYSSFHLHETGLTPIGAPSFEEWLECGRFIRHAEQSVHFWIGDWLAYGEAHFKEDYEEAIALTGYTYHTLRRDKYMAERIPLERRRSTVDVALHHVLQSGTDSGRKLYQQSSNQRNKSYLPWRCAHNSANASERKCGHGDVLPALLGIAGLRC